MSEKQTPTYEKFSAIFLIAGLFFLIIAFLALGLAPAVMVEGVGEQVGMPQEIPADFKKYYGSVDEYQKALLNGRDIYISEACWHCHSQYVRPVSNESLRYGPVSQPGEYQNILNMPQLFGTRRVGPDLSRQSGKHTNDWHFAHLYNPKWVVPQSVMPVYPWYFTVKNKDGKEITPSLEDLMSEDVIIEPKQKAIDLVAYLQWLGSSVYDIGRQYDPDQIILPPKK